MTSRHRLGIHTRRNGREPRGSMFACHIAWALEHDEAEDQRSDGVRQFAIVASRAGHNGSFLSYLGTVPLTDMSVCIPITHRMRFCICGYRSKISPRASLLVKKLFGSGLTKDSYIVVYYSVYVNISASDYEVWLGVHTYCVCSSFVI